MDIKIILFGKINKIINIHLKLLYNKGGLLLWELRKIKEVDILNKLDYGIQEEQKLYKG